MTNWDNAMPNQNIQEPDEKFLWIVVAGTGGKEEFLDVNVPPGTQARDILEQLGLDGYLLEHPDGGAFELNEDVYESIGHKQKIHARPDDVKAATSTPACALTLPVS